MVQPLVLVRLHVKVYGGAWGTKAQLSDRADSETLKETLHAEPGFPRLARSVQGVLLLGGIFGALAAAGRVWARLTTAPGHFIYGRDNWRNNTSLRP
jgi:hypothetical protein